MESKIDIRKHSLWKVQQTSLKIKYLLGSLEDALRTYNISELAMENTKESVTQARQLIADLSLRLEDMFKKIPKLDQMSESNKNARNRESSNSRNTIRYFWSEFEDEMRPYSDAIKQSSSNTVLKVEYAPERVIQKIRVCDNYSHSKSEHNPIKTKQAALTNYFGFSASPKSENTDQNSRLLTKNFVISAKEYQLAITEQVYSWACDIYKTENRIVTRSGLTSQTRNLDIRKLVKLSHRWYKMLNDRLKAYIVQYQVIGKPADQSNT